MVFRFSEIEGEEVFEYLTQGPTESWLHQLTGTDTDAHLKALPIVAEGGVLEEFKPLRVLHIEDNLDIGIQGDHKTFDFTENEKVFQMNLLEITSFSGYSEYCKFQCQRKTGVHGD